MNVSYPHRPRNLLRRGHCMSPVQSHRHRTALGVRGRETAARPGTSQKLTSPLPRRERTVGPTGNECPGVTPCTCAQSASAARTAAPARHCGRFDLPARRIRPQPPDSFPPTPSPRPQNLPVHDRKAVHRQALVILRHREKGPGCLVRHSGPSRTRRADPAEPGQPSGFAPNRTVERDHPYEEIR